MAIKSDLIRVRVTPAEKEQIQKRADELHLSLSQYILFVLFKDIKDNG